MTSVLVKGRRRRRVRAAWPRFPRLATFTLALGPALGAGWAPPSRAEPAPPPPVPKLLPVAVVQSSALDLPAGAPLRRVASLATAPWPPKAQAKSPITRASGELRTVPGGSAASGSGALQRYAVEVERGLGVSAEAFAAAVERTLADRRGWTTPRLRAFRRVDDEPAAFRVTLASPATTDRLCAPLSTRGRLSCFQGGRAVLNARRWLSGAASYRGRRAAYRRYLVNHEVGHALGLDHAGCPRRGARAPIMLQQTKGLQGCRANPWPLPSEDPPPR